jgi:hypothetical protein
VLSVEAEAAKWTRTYDRDLTLDWAHSLVATPDGGYAIAGLTNYSSVGNYDFWLVKTGADGNVEWNQTYGGGAVDTPDSLVVTSDGGYAIAGTTDSYGAGNTDFWLVKTDEFGNVEWNQTYGGELSDRPSSLVVTSDGGYAIAGITNASGVEYGDFWLVKTDADGNMEWNMTYGGADYDIASSLVATVDGGYAIAGGTISFGVGGGDFWLVKTDENGIVPEAAWAILPLLIAATLSIFICKKKLLHNRS